MTITMKFIKRTQGGWLARLLIIFPFLSGTLYNLLGLPKGISYLLDVAWLILLGLMTFFGYITGRRRVKKLALWVLAFFLATLLCYVFQFQSVFYYLWGCRNNFRFFVAFFAFTSFLTQEDVDEYFGLFDKLFWVNAVVSLIQYFVLGYKQDYLGGLFGITKGCNSYTNLFFLIVLTKSIVFYLEDKRKAWDCVAKIFTALLIAALAELKFFFVEFLLLVVLAALMTHFTWRKIWIILGSLAGAVIGAMLLTRIFPLFEQWFSISHILDQASSDQGYTSSGDLNRLNAISRINEIWLTSGRERIFGLGLGNCDTSAYAVVNTPFYQSNGYMHYTWMSHAFMYLECGWMGLIFYFGFFVLVYFEIRKMELRMSADLIKYCRIGRMMAILCVVIGVYNASLRSEGAYMAYFALAVPYICARQLQEQSKT